MLILLHLYCVQRVVQQPSFYEADPFLGRSSSWRLIYCSTMEYIRHLLDKVTGILFSLNSGLNAGAMKLSSLVLLFGLSLILLTKTALFVLVNNHRQE